MCGVTRLYWYNFYICNIAIIAIKKCSCISPSVILPRQNATVSLRFGHGSALTVHRTVIHSLAAASLPRQMEASDYTRKKGSPYGRAPAIAGERANDYNSSAPLRRALCATSPKVRGLNA